MRVLAISLLLIGCLSRTGYAQDEIPMHVIHTGEDKMGIQLKYLLDEKVSASSLFRHLKDPNSARVVLILSTLEIKAKPGYKGTESSISVIVLISTDNPDDGLLFINSHHYIYHLDYIDELAVDILSKIHKDVSSD